MNEKRTVDQDLIKQERMLGEDRYQDLISSFHNILAKGDSIEFYVEEYNAKSSTFQTISTTEVKNTSDLEAYLKSF